MIKVQNIFAETYQFFCSFCKRVEAIHGEELDDLLSSSGACRVCGDKSWHVYNENGEILI